MTSTEHAETSKQKVTVSVDRDALDQAREIGKAEPSLSAYVNRLLLDDLALERQRQQLLGVVADYEVMFGTVDPDRVEYFENLLS